MRAVKPAPLNATFMLTAILGFLISVVYVRKISMTWAFAFGFVFLLMIFASLISMIQAPVRGQLMPNLEKEMTEPKLSIFKTRKRSAKRKSKKKPAKKKKSKKKAKKAKKKR